MEEPGPAGELVGARFGPYRLHRLLGRGGFGEVYEAEDTEKNRLVALKLMAVEYSHDPVFRQRLFREASTAGRLNEPHVVPVHSYGEIDGQLYIDMRLVRGTDLATVLANEGALDPARAVWIVRQIASALDAAHGAGLVHRDVKPANILVGNDDFACLVDFGLANAASDTKLTSTGATIGTLAYMAPERFTHAAAVDHRADVYALACVLFECLTGTQPYPARGDLSALMGAHLGAPIPRASQYRPQLPVALDEVIARGMAKDPAARHQGAGELARGAWHALIPSVPSRDDTVQAATHAGSLSPTQAAPVLDPAARASPPPLPIVPLGRKVKPQAQSRRLSRRTATMMTAIVAGVVVVVVTVIVSSVARDRPSSRSQQTTSPSQQPALPSQQTVLPFTGLDHPQGVTVDAAGTVYVADRGNQRVLALRPGSGDQTVLPFTDLKGPWGVAVDEPGNFYVTDLDGDKVLKQTAGLSGQGELPFGIVSSPKGVTVDPAGNVYLVDGDTVERRAAQPAHPMEQLVTDLTFPVGVAVDAAGNVYVSDGGNNRVLKLLGGSTDQADLPFTGLSHPWGVAVDATGAVYVADGGNHRVLKLPAGDTNQIELPFTGLTSPRGVAVDDAGSVYVSDQDSDKVLKLSAR